MAEMVRALFVAWLLATAPATAFAAAAGPGTAAAPFVPRPCPAGLDAVAACHAGRDANGAWLLVAVPRQWNRVLVVHAHGGPRLGAPGPEDGDEDLDRFAVMVRSGFAWIGSSYRRGGYGVRMAAADVDASRALFWSAFGRPRLTILHGQSYGGNVAAKLAELGALDAEGGRLYDGVLLTNAILSGGTRAYGFRADLRAVYSHICRNHPRPDEPAYPLWQGLPADSAMTEADLAARVNQCTGLDRPAGERSAEQGQRLATITAVTGIAERHLLRHLEWATFTFRDLVHRRLGGRNPFDNSRTRYSGSADDAALNREIARFTADPVAVAALRYDSDLSGRIIVPTLALHWRDDPIVSAEASAAYGRQVADQGGGHLFLRFSTREGTHGRLADAEYAAALAALLGWIETGERPAAQAVVARCVAEAGAHRGNCSME